MPRCSAPLQTAYSSVAFESVAVLFSPIQNHCQVSFGFKVNSTSNIYLQKNYNTMIVCDLRSLSVKFNQGVMYAPDIKADNL